MSWRRVSLCAARCAGLVTWETRQPQRCAGIAGSGGRATLEQGLVVKQKLLLRHWPFEASDEWKRKPYARRGAPGAQFAHLRTWTGVRYWSPYGGRADSSSTSSTPQENTSALQS